MLRTSDDELGRLLKEQLGPIDEEKLREIEERMRQDARKPAPKAPPTSTRRAESMSDRR